MKGLEIKLKKHWPRDKENSCSLYNLTHVTINHHPVNVIAAESDVSEKFAQCDLLY